MLNNALRRKKKKSKLYNDLVHLLKKTVQFLPLGQNEEWSVQSHEGPNTQTQGGETSHPVSVWQEEHRLTKKTKKIIFISVLNLISQGLINDNQI